MSTPHDDDARRSASPIERPVSARSRDADDALPAELAAAIATLRRLPTPAPGATARIVAAATGGPQLGTRPRGWRDAAWLEPLRSQSMRRALAAAAVVAVAVGAGSMLRAPGAPRVVVAADVRGAGSSAPVAPEASVPATLLPVAATAGLADEAPRPVVFVLHRPGARSVSLVGDFNGWDADSTPLAVEEGGSGTWAVTLTLTPGRHAYGFLVDGDTWVLDPQAPEARDADYGRDHSVVVVGIP